MGMTMTQKILADHAGLSEVSEGDLIEAKNGIFEVDEITLKFLKKVNPQRTDYKICKADDDAYPLSIDVSGFDVDFVSHEAIFGDPDQVTSPEDDTVFMPKVSSDAVYENGILKTYVKPFSWNVIVFEV